MQKVRANNIAGLFLLAVVLCSYGCGSNGVSPTTRYMASDRSASSLAHRRVPKARRHARATSCSTTPSAQNCISHIFIIVQENRSFNNIFQGFSDAGGIAESASTGLMSTTGQTVPIVQQPFEAETPAPQGSGDDPNHSYQAAIQAWDGPSTKFVGATGKMDGFDQNTLAPGKYLYRSVTQAEVAPYWTLAKKYTLADHMFPTELGPSWTGHINLVAANTELQTYGLKALVNFPGSGFGCQSGGPFTAPLLDSGRGYTASGGPTCIDGADMSSLANVLDQANVSWAYYAPPVYNDNLFGELWSPFNSFNYVANGDCTKHSCWNNNVISSPKQILTDINNYTAGSDNLPNVVWVSPSDVNSDHAGSCTAPMRNEGVCQCPYGIGCTSTTGPYWVAQIYNSIHKKSALWAHSAVVVVWDDWGGWYDEVSPPQLDARGLGIRVPCIIMSPYAKPHYIIKERLEFGSIVRFIEQVYQTGVIGPATAGYTDVTHGPSKINSIMDAFDFTQVPENDGTTISSPYSQQFFLNIDETSQPPPDTE